VGALAASALLFVLVSLDVVYVRWDAELLPNCMLFLVVPSCIVGLIVSIVSAIVHRDRLSSVGIVVGILATAASVITLGLIVVTAMARHPI